MNEQRSIHNETLRRHAEDEQVETGRALEGRHKLVRALCLTVVGLALVGGVGLAVWQSPYVSEGIAQSSNGQKKSRKASSQDDGNTNPFIRHANNAGVSTCRDTYAALGEALTAGSHYMAQTETANTDPDRHSVQGLVGLNYNGPGDYNGPAAGLVLATPTPGGKSCEGTLVRVVPFRQSCQAASRMLPYGSRQGNPLSGIPVFALPNNGYAMLVPLGHDCIVLSVVRGAGKV